MSCSDPQTLWIGEIIRNGEGNYREWWQKKIQSLSYLFKEEVELFSDTDFDALFRIEGSRHPEVLKMHLQGKISLETMIILDRILGYKSKFDKKLKDPVWELTSMKMSKYSPFQILTYFVIKKFLNK